MVGTLTGDGFYKDKEFRRGNDQHATNVELKTSVTKISYNTV